MREPTSRDVPWLDERLRSVEPEGPGLDVVRSPLRPVVERSDPWQSDLRRHDLSAILGRLQPDDGERSLAKVVVVTDVEEDPVGRVQATAMVARRLAEAGREVLLVDADLRHVGLSRWVPDRELDAEGLVDVLQYGASVVAVRRPGPIDHTQLLSVGSYRPDGLDVFEEDAVARLVAQLRHAAEIVLVVTPAWLPNEKFHPLLVHADTVVVSMHLDRSLATPLEELLRYLRGLNVPIAGLIAFAGPDAAEQRVDDVLRERDPWREAEAAPEELEDEPASRSPWTSGGVEDALGRAAEEASAMPADELDAASREVVVAAGASRGYRPVGEETPPRGFRRKSSDIERSSPVFRFALIGVLLVLLAFVGWWGLTQRTHPAPTRPGGPGAGRVESRPTGGAARDLRPPVDAAANQAPVESTTAAAAPETLATVAEPVAEPQETPSTSAGTEESSGASESVESEGETGEPEASTSRTPSSARSPEPSTQEPETTEPAASPANGTETPAGDAVESWEEHVARAVGGGFALHLFSFPDSIEALSVLGKLERLGWQPAIRGADIPGRGHWYRVLVGSFDSRAAALAARESVGERAGVDWVGVVRVP